MPSALGELIYTPPHPENTRIDKFRRIIAEKYKVDLPNYEAFWKWSCASPSDFWSGCWKELDIISSKGYEQALAPNSKIYPPPRWFEGARLNIAENLLRHSRPDSPLLDSPALYQACEPDPASPSNLNIRTTTQRQLRSQVAYAVEALRKRGIKEGDRIASYSANCSDNLVAFLASAAIGAIWVSCAADFAPQGVLERLQSVRPKLLFAIDGVRYNGRVHDHIGKVKEVVKGLRSSRNAEQQELEGVVIIPYCSQIGGESKSEMESDWSKWSDFLAQGKEKENGKIDFEQLDFNHPLWILFSSGTTGSPKAILHRSGGMLLQSSKEHLLHGDMSPKDVFFYYSTIGWMMWNYLITGLVSGAPLVIFDGSPLRTPSMLWSLSDQLGVTVFGTSAAYISALEKTGFVPKKEYPNLKITQVLSTGSPLRAELYSFVRDSIGDKIMLSSITGGTDICSLFGSHNVALPVYAGEIQARGLGMDVDVFDDAGKSIPPGGGSGDLVCKTPFPAQPLGFYQQSESRHFETYYAQFPGVWYHGDYVALSKNSGLQMGGRSDGIINAGGIRYGTAQIYTILENNKTTVKHLDQVSQSLVCALKTPKGDDEVAVLFLVLQTTLSEQDWSELQISIKKLIREKESARHVPKFIEQIEGVPLTLNGKLAEVPAKKSESNLAVHSNPSAKLSSFFSNQWSTTLDNQQCYLAECRCAQSIYCGRRETPTATKFIHNVIL
jgi:acetoacetyl-CoA synthetase